MRYAIFPRETGKIVKQHHRGCHRSGPGPLIKRVLRQERHPCVGSIILGASRQHRVCPCTTQRRYNEAMKTTSRRHHNKGIFEFHMVAEPGSTTGQPHQIQNQPQFNSDSPRWPHNNWATTSVLQAQLHQTQLVNNIRWRKVLAQHLSSSHHLRIKHAASNKDIKTASVVVAVAIVAAVAAASPTTATKKGVCEATRYNNSSYPPHRHPTTNNTTQQALVVPRETKKGAAAAATTTTRTIGQ